MMDRRKFLWKTLGTGFTLGTAKAMAHDKIAENDVLLNNSEYDLIAAMGGNPDEMFDKAIAAMGGIGKYVKRGQTVVVKPNIGWDATPERAANTNPILVKRIVQHCKDAGAKDVFVFDNTCDNWNRCYENSGIQRAVREAGGRMVSGATESYYQNVQIPNATRIKNAKVHELILNSDVFINVPVLKHHSSTRLTIAMKNLMGIVWDRQFWHQNDLNRCIAEFTRFRKPDLNVIDAYAIMMRNGPRGVSTADVVVSKSLIISPDPVAADAAAAKIFGMEPHEVGHIRIADELGVGTMDLSKLNIHRIRV
ncbi:MAG: DUF362 domain-containing protein [Cyclobacteriaceae bacterium]|nr:DUF362 domain-containing protein [Cyclobacteriaceae bacterium]